MNFWEFLDRQIGRISPSGAAGAGIFTLSLYVLEVIRSNPELAKDDLYKTLAQAVIVQGLIGLAMASWFTRNRPRIDDRNAPAESPPPDHHP